MNKSVRNIGAGATRGRPLFFCVLAAVLSALNFAGGGRKLRAALLVMMAITAANADKVSGLKLGQYYTVEMDGVKYYAKSDGTLSKNITDVGMLRVTEIKGVPAGKTPKVTASAQYPVEYANLSNDDRLMIDRINALVDDHFENRSYDEKQKKSWNVTGLAVGVIKNGKVFFFNRGYHESEQRKVAERTKVTENSVFGLASMSKPITGCMLSYMSRNADPATGKPYVNLDDPINKYFETAPYIDSDGTPIHPTLLQLASHKAGFPREPVVEPSVYGIDKFKASFEKVSYVHKPGTKYLYSNLGICALANTLTYVRYGDEFPKKKALNDLLQELFCKPLGLESTAIRKWTASEYPGRVALPHSFDGGPLIVGRPLDFHLRGGNGGVSSTAAEVILWLALFTGDFVPVGAEGLYEAATAGISWKSENRATPNTALSPHGNNIAKLGGKFEELFPRPANARQRYGLCYEHGGGRPGYRTRSIACPETKTAAVVLVNAHEGAGDLVEHIMDRALNITHSAKRTPFNNFDDRVASYNAASGNIDVAVSENLTLDMVMDIPIPKKTGATLTIRSANPAKPVTLTRGAKGNLFTVSNGATLILRDIIIDGGGNINFADDGGDGDEGYYDEENSKPAPAKKPADDGIGVLARADKGGTLIMNAGAVLRNNVNSGSGGGVWVSGGAFIMNDGKISGNTSNGSGGGVLVGGGTFIMNGGQIYGNASNKNGGGAFIYNGGVFTMAGGEIKDNAAKSIGGVYAYRDGKFNMNGGVVAGTGKNINTVVYGEYELNNDAMAVVWNKPDDAPPNYPAGVNTHLSVLPDKAATAVWAMQGGILGISYKNGANAGFIAIGGKDAP